MPELLPAGLPAPARGVFTTRAGGVSAPPYDGLDLALHVEDDPAAVAANRAALVEALDADRLAFADQVHGDAVAVVEAGGPETAPAVDALVTAEPGTALVVLAADCLPVLLADPVAGVVGAAHAGRQGLLAGVLQQAVRAMAALGAEPGRVEAVVGPAAGACCYEVPAAMADDAEARLPGTRSTTRAGTPSLDLRGGAERVLRQAGLADVRHVDHCTIDDARFYSYRRDGRTGRHAGAVWLPRG
ncbi:MAG TPA: peptidoglycan editing factor PgeF [Mycobacteriales bacterium]|nr:peptidoglycan editing factor PgeF [Mycobacteriales bacterium]